LQCIYSILLVINVKSTVLWIRNYFAWRPT
jgi:hypothetical protein